jgi:flavin reductase (DIM6/NTAB) family NADH-FMN oxidoreductase RutF
MVRRPAPRPIAAALACVLLWPAVVPPFARAGTLSEAQAVRHTLGHARAPLIQGALAHFECSPYAHYDGGDHVILLGRVLRFSTHPDEDPGASTAA